MDPLLIPHEGKTEKQKRKKNNKIKTERFSQKETHNLLVEIRKKLEVGIDNRDQKILTKTCIKLLEFLDPVTDYSLEKINELLKSLQRSTISIQRKKKKIIEEEHQKINKKNKRRGK